tara:strand:+ start:2454 stop:2738 length:285 start_codon:yes stop_codon:yes gene_type:complete
MSTTSLKLPDEIKQLAVAAAKLRGVSTHAFMVEAIQSAASAEKQRAEFVADALEARAKALRSGKGFAAADVHKYIAKRGRGLKAAKPRAKSWLK